MKADRLLEHYTQIAAAPDAIARLRRFILDLAVRGKLVPQDASDEPASELLKQIAKEKARLVKAGDLRKPRDLDNGGELDEPFAIPATWQWARLDTVGAIVGGGTPSAADADNFAEPGEGVPWLTPADLGGYSDLYISRGARDLSDMGSRSSSATVMPKGTVLFTSRAPIGYVAIAANPISTNQGFKSIVPYIADCSRFIAIAMKAFAPEVDAKAPGTTFKEVSGKIVAAISFPLPPLAEQHRIVAKVDKLMALFDRLEAACASREAARDRLAAASLARLNTPDPETFQADARFALDALPALTTRPDQIKQLRQSILNLALRGKLVPQDANDEPANLKPTDCEQWPGAPLMWRYTRLVNLLAEDTRNGYSRKPDEAPTGTPILRISAGTVRRDGVVAEEEHKLISGIDSDARHQYGLRPGDLLACRFNGNKAFVGRLTIFRDYLGLKPIYPDKLIRIRVSPDLAVPEFLRLAGDTDLVRTEVETVCATTVGNWGISASNLKEIRFPVPPLAEQHRIVAKVDALMALCDRLEASLTATAATRRRLLDALLAEALAPAEAREMEAAE
jgi:type I restriction enzyme S subunit